MTVRELSQKMSSSELSEWIAYNNIERLPDPWQQSAQLCDLIANAHGMKIKGRRPKPADFIPRVRVHRREQSAEEQHAILAHFLPKQHT